ncbi:MAG: hypothetical protein KKB21_05645 [Nanoarchaeota archaeon]|nr:hypothetical protein [Nanoarchaeota archaeon]MBU4087031.1 hypothetical protein [Nanoarchaeota archaeon]
MDNDPYLHGITSGMDGRHFRECPYDKDNQHDQHIRWREGWGLGRTCLEWDNPANIPVKKHLTREKDGRVTLRLIPVDESEPIVPGIGGPIQDPSA